MSTVMLKGKHHKGCKIEIDIVGSSSKVGILYVWILSIDDNPYSISKSFKTYDMAVDDYKINGFVIYNQLIRMINNR